MTTLRLIRSAVLVALAAASVTACEETTTVDPPAAGSAKGTLEGNISANRTLTKDTTYVLKGYVKVQNGATLTIQAGTRLVGDTTTPGSSLWILRGGRIQAQGTAAEPIVFTSQRSAPNRKPGDWGGIVVVGNGQINRTGTIQTEGPAGISENYGGGTSNTDNSGTIRYVRIEFAGFDVSGGAGSELNGLSLYAVGSGTLLEYVEVLAGLDDSFEFWGGAVDGRYLLSYEAGDDHFDWSEGWVGRVQFAVAFQNSRIQPAPGTGTTSTDPQGFESDGCSGSGCTNGFRSTPYSYPVFANFAIVGMGATETQAAGGFGAVLRRGTAGFLTNGIFARWKGTGLSVRDNVTDTLLIRDSLVVANVILAENGANYEAVGTNFAQDTKFAGDNHRTGATAASLFTSLATGTVDWAPATGAVSATGGGTVTIPAARTANFFGGTLTNTTYVGPADPAGPKWWLGWSAYAAN